MLLTFITIAQNEEKKIAGCIQSTRGLGRHIVIDGGSQDQTVEIARAEGAEVSSRPFKYPADQYNHGLAIAGTEWAFVLDADERLDATLRQSLMNLTRLPREAAGGEVARKNSVFGKVPMHGGWYPDWNVRLMRRGEVTYEDREVHARVVTHGAIVRLDGHITHETYDGIDQYLRKLLRLTDRELLARQRQNASSEKRAALRQIWLRSPLKPLTKFALLYFVRQGFRDGRLGLDLAILGSFYEYVVALKGRYGNPRD